MSASQVGLACCQIGKQLGANILGTAGTKDGLDLVLANGAKQAFNHKEKGYTQQIMVMLSVNALYL